MTKISELKIGMKNLLVEGYIVETDTVRIVQGRYDNNEYKVCKFWLSETKKPTKENSVTLILWESDIERFRIGDHVKIENGYTTTFQDSLQLNVGKYGKIMLCA